MNSSTGQIYHEPEEIGKAFLRNEPLVPISQNVAGLSRKQRMRVGNAIANLKRTRPNLTNEQREELAIKVASS
jgi:hypothetical protein